MMMSLSFFPVEEAGVRSPATSPVHCPFTFLLLKGPSLGRKDNNGPGAGVRRNQKRKGKGEERQGGRE